MNLHTLIEEFFSYISSYPKDITNIIILGILFIGSILESLPFIGMFFPMETFTVLVGVFAYKGIIDIKFAILVTFLGLLIGDSITFEMGKKLGEDYLRKHAQKIKISHEKYTRIKYLINNNITKALFLARTNNFTRWIVPFLAGANNLSYKKFLMANIITASFWAPLFLFGGYFLGDAFEKYGKYFGLGILGASVITYIGYKIYKHFEKKGIFKHKDFKIWLINVFGLYLFSKMLEDVTDLELITKFDFFISSHIHELYNPILNKIMIFITSIDNPLPVAVISFLLISYFLYKKYYFETTFFITSILTSASLVFIIKNLVKRPRPLHKLIEVGGYSFPSGHATISTALAFSLYLIFKDKVKSENLLLILAVIYPIMISFTRVYLNVHYVSDVLAGIGLGLFSVSMVYLTFELMKK